MRRIYILLTLLGTLVASSCSDFLDETPNKSGSAYIYHMDQLYGMTGSLDLYLFGNVYEEEGMGSVGMYMTEINALTDAVEISPEYNNLLQSWGDPWTYDIYRWSGKESLLTEMYMMWTWEPVWQRIYTFNTVLEYLDKVEQTTEAIRHQVEGEARFGRAYYHFMLLTQYCLWGDDQPGIGYRDNATAGEIPGRETVKYTIDRIYRDLELAEAALTEAGRTEFDAAHKYRPTVPTVQALRARVALYHGDYGLALSNAKNALKAHHSLVDFKNEPEYELEELEWIMVLNEDKELVDEITLYYMPEMEDLDMEAIAGYEELYLPAATLDGGMVPVSESFYNLWDHDNDARWIYFYSYRFPFFMAYYDCLEFDEDTYEMYMSEENWLKFNQGNLYSYNRFNSNVLLGMTTAEMYLIQAECEARAGNAGEAARLLKELRYTRFMDEESAEEGITGSVQDVLDERLREMGAFWRFYDIKRLNGKENAGIHVRREVLTDPADASSVTRLDIAPGDPRWALPFYSLEADMMGWEQNRGWE